jgi:RND family efflux transporter MFP subunit
MSDQLSNDLQSLTIHREAKPSSGAGLKVGIAFGVVFALTAIGYLVIYPYVSSRLWKTEVETGAIAMVSPAQASTQFAGTGYVVPQVDTKIGARIPGRLSKVLVHEGDVVKEGQLIAQVEDADQRAAIAAANSRVAAARARAETARAQMAEAKQQADRERALVAKGVSGKANLEDLDARVRSLGTAVTAAEADVRAAQAEVASIRVNLDLSEVIAPVNGTVVTKPMAVGELVGPTALTPIVELADFSSLLVEVDVPERDFGKAKVPTPCEIILDSAPDTRYRGEVVELSKRIDRAKASGIVKVKFLDPIKDVVPDMAARVNFLSAALDENAVKEPPKLVVPKEAVTERGGQKVVFVVDGEQVRQVGIIVGGPFGNGFELKTGSGLQPGTKVVLHPTPKLRDGQKVKEKNE